MRMHAPAPELRRGQARMAIDPAPLFVFIGVHASRRSLVRRRIRG
jgi:hypothetical protein